MAELPKFFEKAEESKLNADNAYFFMYYIEEQIDHLMSLSKELNEEYATVNILL